MIKLQSAPENFLPTLARANKKGKSKGGQTNEEQIVTRKWLAQVMYQLRDYKAAIEHLDVLRERVGHDDELEILRLRSVRVKLPFVPFQKMLYCHGSLLYFTFFLVSRGFWCRMIHF